MNKLYTISPDRFKLEILDSIKRVKQCADAVRILKPSTSRAVSRESGFNIPRYKNASVENVLRLIMPRRDKLKASKRWIYQ